MTLITDDYIESRVRVKVTPGEVLKMLRELQGMSQNDLAKKTGISQPNISAIENESKQMGRSSALLLAKALKVHPAVLLFPDYDYRDAA